ncbi:amino acid ABC transporter substrate-binding protein [Phenylobacterium sp.]|uniref:amino acid ABC transporter substrate-binding protein n=1 Tax=Phenylobacterium sp. TaxID=1871053 RepID=UPI002721D07A|nr:amino acid ABC transporter substrate-binding protein [Phenylobacterium sp.]MDO8798738.1 amino acid ABC transporter substrate-binding protein [Phenylobacterium sp.]
MRSVIKALRRTAAVGFLLLLAACGRGEQTPAPPAGETAASDPATQVLQAKASPTLAAVRARGYLSCGVHPGLAGFAFPDDKGGWRGFDVDMCRAVAAAVLGDAKAVRFTATQAQDRFAALSGGKIDLLSRNTSWTFARDAGSLDFPAVAYFDGQGFLATRALALATADELNGARICVQAGTDSEDNLAAYFKSRGLKYSAVVSGSEAEARETYQSGGCDAFTADVSALASARSLMNNPNAHVILPTVISKEPLGPVVRQDDPAWTDIVRWSVYALMLGEELKLTSETVAKARDDSQDPRVRRLLGVEGNLGPLLGLKADWGFQVIRQVGAYDEVFRRNLGQGSPLKLERGLNALWSAPQPGLHYPPPVR